jgi:hypothetical protein
MSYYEIENLRKEGFKIEQKSPWHFIVIKGKRYINIWPSKRKWMVMYGSGASFYGNAEELLGIVRNLFGKKRNPRWLVDQLIKEMEAAKTPRQREAEAFQKEWLGVLVEYLTLP